MCSDWTNGSTALQTASTGSVVAVDGSGAGGDDLLKFTKAPTACGTFTLGTMSTAGQESAVTASALALNLSSSILDTGDNALVGYPYTTASGTQF